MNFIVPKVQSSRNYKCGPTKYQQVIKRLFGKSIDVFHICSPVAQMKIRSSCQSENAVNINIIGHKYRFFLRSFFLSKKVSGGVVCFLNIVSTPGLVLSRSRLGWVRLVTRLSKARFGQVGDQVDQAEDLVCHGQGQELDKNRLK